MKDSGEFGRDSLTSLTDTSREKDPDLRKGSKYLCLGILLVRRRAGSKAKSGSK